MHAAFSFRGVGSARNPKQCGVLVLMSLFGAAAVLPAAMLTKANNTTALDQAASWSPASVPGSADTLSWNGTFTDGAAGIGAGLTVNQLKITSPSQPVTINAGNGSLTLGAGGMDLSTATQNLTVAAPVALGGNQTWVAGTGRSLLVTGSVTGSSGYALTINSGSNAGSVILSPSAGNSVSMTGNSSTAIFLQARTGGLLVLGGDGVTAPATVSTNTIVNGGTYGAMTIIGGGAVRVNSGTWNLGDLSRNGSGDFFSGLLDVRGGTVSFNGARFLAAGNITVSGGTLKITNTGSVYSNGGKFALGSTGSNGTATMTVTGGLVDLAQANGSVNGANSIGVAISTRVKQTGGTVQNGMTAGGGTNGGIISTFTIGNTGLTSTGSNATLTYTAVSNNLSSYTLEGGTLLSAGAIQGNTPASPGTNGSSGSPPNAVVNPGTGNVRNFNFNGGTLAVAAFNATYLGYSSSNGTAGGEANADPAANSVGIGTLCNNGGTLAPGGSGIAGKTAITGNYVVNAGTFAVDLGGTTQASAFQTGQHDYLTVSGTTALGGNLSVSVLPGFTPTGNNTFTVLTSTGNLTGNFTNVPFGGRVVSADGLHTFAVSQVGNSVALGQYLPVTAPVITSAVGPASVLAGNSLVLAVTAGSLAPVNYQWRKNGVAIDGATFSSLSILGAHASDAGAYDVVVSNASGSVISAFTLSVITPPPSTMNVVVAAGATHTFDAGPSAASYVWLLDGAPVGTDSVAFTYAPDTNAVGTHWLQVKETYADNSTVVRQWGVRVRIPVPVSPIQYYVSPNGSDSGSGAIGSPFLTLEKARDTIRAIGKPLPAGGATVFLRGGTHVRTSTLTLNATDSGTDGAPIIYTGYPGETAIITGGKSLLASQFAPLASSEIPRVAPGVDATRIWEFDLIGIAHAGALPNVFNEWQIFSALRSGGAGLCEVFYNGKRMVLSRYPNHDLTNEADTANLKMDGVAMDSTGSGYLFSSGNYTTSNGTIVAVGGAFHYNAADADHVARWQAALAKGGVWLAGYWRVPWQMNGVKVGLIDSGANQVIAFSSNATVPNGIGDKYTRPAGGNHAEPYWVVNLLEELDQPGEWCIDFARKKLYFLMDAAGTPPDNSVVLSDLGGPLVQITGSYVYLQSLSFQNQLGEAVQIQGGSRNLVLGCSFKNIGNFAVDINGGTFNGAVACSMENLASGGIILRGGTEPVPPTPAVDANNFAVNNKFRSFGEVVRVYQGAVDFGSGGPIGTSHVVAVGMRVAHNDAAGTPHGAYYWGSYNNVFEYNEASDFCQVSNDMGGIYRFGPNYDSNSVIRYNYIHDSLLGEAYYFDFDHVNVAVYGNVANLHTPATAPRGYGFWTNTNGAVGGAVPGVSMALNLFNNIAVNSKGNYALHSATGGKIENNVAYVSRSYDFSWALVQTNNSTNSIATSNNATLASGPNISYGADPGFIDFAHDDLRLRPDAKAYADMPGFEPIPLEMAGLYNDEYRSDAKVYSPFATTGSATAVGGNTATFNGELVYPQFDANATVLLYWGTADGGTSAAAWQNVANLGTPGSGAVFKTLTDLAPDTRYFFRFHAANSAGAMWAEQSNSTTTSALAGVASGGNATADSAAAPAANAFDGDPATKWQSGVGLATGWIQYQFAAGTSFAVTQYQITSAADSPSRDPRDWQFLGSNDGVNWVVLDTRSGQSFSARGQTLTYGFSSITPYKYYRLSITANNGDAAALQLADLRLSAPVAAPDTTGPVITTQGNMTVEATSVNGAYVSYSVQAVDIISGNVTPVLTPPSGSLFAHGTTTVNATATDAAGNTSTANFTVTVTPPSLPFPWTVQQIGTVAGGINSCYAACSLQTGTFNITGGGGDIGSGTSEAFTHTWQPWTGDGIFTARLDAFTSTSPNAKAGIMFRETLVAGSKNSLTYMTRSGNAFAQQKASTGGAVSSSSLTGRSIPCWVRLVRSGNTFSNFTSPDGSTWTQIGSSINITMTGGALNVGFAVAPVTVGTTANATFDNISFLGIPSAPTGLAAAAGAGNVSLTWNAVPTAASYSVKRAAVSGGNYTTVAAGLSAPSYADTGLPPGVTGFYVVTATNAVGESAASGPLAAAPFSVLEAWRFTKFGTDAVAGADTADQDLDGLPNLVEYALGTNPKLAAADEQPVVSLAAGRARITFRRIADPAVTYHVEAATQLGAWTEIWQSTGAANTAGSISVDDTQTVASSNPPRRFLRLRITVP